MIVKCGFILGGGGSPRNMAACASHLVFLEKWNMGSGLSMRMGKTRKECRILVGKLLWKLEIGRPGTIVEGNIKKNFRSPGGGRGRRGLEGLSIVNPQVLLPDIWRSWCRKNQTCFMTWKQWTIIRVPAVSLGNRYRAFGFPQKEREIVWSHSSATCPAQLRNLEEEQFENIWKLEREGKCLDVL
jgi:hypothetical protein